MFDYSAQTMDRQINKLLSELQYIRKSSEKNVALYLLYHPKAGDEVNPMFEIWQKNNQTYPISYANYVTEYTPVILVLNLANSAHEKILYESLREALDEIHPDKLNQFKPRRIYGWLFSTLPAEILASQLGFIAIQSRNDHEELIRYFDPSILSTFVALLNSKQAQKVLRPITNWLYINGDGQMEVLKNPQNVKKHITSDLALSNSQWSMTEDIVIRNRVLIRYRKSLLTAERMIESQCDKLIFGSIKQARDCGYTQQQDLIEYSYYSLYIHPQIMLHQEIIKQIHKTSYPLKSILSKISSQKWQEMKQELEGKNNDKM